MAHCQSAGRLLSVLPIEVPVAAERFIYQSAPTTKHKGRVSTYYVETFPEADDNVVARITSLGLVKEEEVHHKAELFSIKEGMTVAGTWRPTKSHRHERVSLILGSDYE